VAGSLNPQRYIQIPDMSLDDEGTNNANIVTRTSLGRPTVACGNTADVTIANRITDCEAKNGANARWDGVSNGAAGEGNWRLVALLDNGKEIW
ncbi:hypothetical protein, partial [Klebsiella pneumoniae]|uniref:hypothetical protein n=1 Tax=Klebsiella pneumoniae TaxID=573 RepID=UPI001BA739DC